MSAPLHVIVLAAGKGTRLKSDLPKVLHPLFGKPLLERVLCTFESLQIQQALVVVGHGREAVTTHLETLSLSFPIQTVVQNPPAGTGDAVLCVKRHAAGKTLAGSQVVITSGDIPLVDADTFQTLIAEHNRQKNHLTLLVTDLANPTGYGRVICQSGRVSRVVEEKDASEKERAIPTVNTGLYCLDWDAVSPLLEKLSPNNAQKELYLTDLIQLSVEAGLQVGVCDLQNSDLIRGINSRADLAQCQQVLNQRTLARLMDDGVTIVDPTNTMIAPEVLIGSDTVIYPGCYLEGSMILGRACMIGPHTMLLGAVRVGDGSRVVMSLVQESEIGSHTQVGPFAHLRQNAHLADHVRVGNFVEVKNTRIGSHSNAAHLSYLGDAQLGEDVNIGAGTITANYDPVRKTKNQTILKDGVKVGCNSVLVAPVTVGEQACVAAGSVITDSVEPFDLAIARPRQSTISGWVRTVSEALPAAVSSKPDDAKKP